MWPQLNPCDLMSPHVTSLMWPHVTVWPQMTSCNLMWPRSCDLMRPHLTLCDLILPYVTSCDLKGPYVTSYNLASRWTPMVQFPPALTSQLTCNDVLDLSCLASDDHYPPGWPFYLLMTSHDPAASRSLSLSLISKFSKSISGKAILLNIQVNFRDQTISLLVHKFLLVSYVTPDDLGSSPTWTSMTQFQSIWDDLQSISDNLIFSWSKIFQCPFSILFYSPTFDLIWLVSLSTTFDLTWPVSLSTTLDLTWLIFSLFLSPAQYLSSLPPGVRDTGQNLTSIEPAFSPFQKVYVPESPQGKMRMNLIMIDK